MIYRLFLLLFVLNGFEFTSFASFLKSKQINCGYVDVDENVVDQYQASIATVKQLIANLSECLPNESNFTSFTLVGSRVVTDMFRNYFALDDDGLVYVRQPRLDREELCAKAKSSSDPSINCECRSEKCELNFKFIAFREKKANKPKRIQQNSPDYKYLSLSINVKDVNDQKPTFSRHFTYLNTSEHIGSSSFMATFNSTSTLCNTIKLYDSLNYPKSDHWVNVNNLMPLEKAVDMDVGRNGEIAYKLVLLKSDDLDDDYERLDKMKKLLNNHNIRPCLGLFELVENVRFNDDYYNYEAVQYDAVNNARHDKRRGSVFKEQLYLKINTYLDREVQQVIKVPIK